MVDNSLFTMKGEVEENIVLKETLGREQFSIQKPFSSEEIEV